MKMMKLTYLMALVLVVALTATGCKNHKPVGVTKLPSGTGSTIPEAPPGNTLPSDVNPSTTGGGPTASLDTFEGMTKDTAALAAYTVHFAYDSAAVRKSEQANIQAVADALNKDSSAKLLIEGNCDERGTEEYNRALGERRALATRQSLHKLGIDPARIRTISYGKDKPLDPANNEAAWSKNRRDDFVLLHPASGS
jgi:peptidoglycan-associated lipoprotein